MRTPAKTVFLSYRQTSDAERARVREFAERLRKSGIKVILDQFFLEENPGGPDDGWDKWSSDRALETERVIIIGSKSWFQCFDKKQKPGTGLGAACEADDLRHRIYEAGGVIESIRVVLFDDADAKHIPGKLKRYHRFDAARDFDGIVKWLGGTVPAPATGKTLASNIPHNLPHLPFFYGRTEELRKIADALSPKTRTWGALIDGPGGIGKTSLAIRAALEAPEGQFRQILFVSSKSRKLTADGEVKVTDFVIPGYIEMLNEIARLLKQPDLAKSPETDRARLVIEALEPAQALLILDNLESLPKDDQNRLFEFLSQLPPGCKAIVTSRRRTDQDARIIRLAKLEQDDALKLLGDLENDRPLLKKVSREDRIHLYEETGGNPLLIRWVAGQLGRGHCRTIATALAFLRSAPKGNDPLEFIFGDLLGTFTEAETKVLAALTYFTQPAGTKLIAELAGISKTAAETALGDLASRALVIPDEEEQHFVLVPMAAVFLRNKRPEAVKESGDRIEKRAYALILQNGGQNYDRFPNLDAEWESVAAAIPLFLAGPNERLQMVCRALLHYMIAYLRLDELLSLNRHAKDIADAARDFYHAGSRDCDAGFIYWRRGEADAVIESANRALAYWNTAKADAGDRAAAIRLRGLGHYLKQEYKTAIAAHKEALKLWQTLPTHIQHLAVGTSDLAGAEMADEQLDAAELHFREALRIANAINDISGVAAYTGSLVTVAINRGEWNKAEALAREAVILAEKVHRKDLIAIDYCLLAHALLRQEKYSEAIKPAQRALGICIQYNLENEAERSRAILSECRAALLSNLHPGWTYNTTTLEGSTLTKAEVAQALADPKAKIAKRPAEHVAAVRAQDAANKALGKWLGEDRDFTKDDLFSLHTVLMQGSTVDSMKPVGTWKMEDNGTRVRLDGKSQWNHHYAAAQHTSALMEEWLDQFNKRREGAGDAFADHVWLHATFVRIHPFADGNGRMARMLANVPLMAGGHPEVEIPATARDRYLAALARWQFACGAPRPNAPLFTKEGELKDFIALCRESQTMAAQKKKAPAKVKAAPKSKPTPRPRKPAPKRKK